MDSSRVKPIVVIDARMVGPVPHGIARFVGKIGRAFAQKSDISYELKFLVHEKYTEPRFFGFEVIRCKSAFLNPREWIEIPLILKREGAKLYHSTSFSSLPFCPVPHVISVHDLNHLQYGSGAQKIYYALLLKRFTKSAVAVTTVSKFAQSEIAQWLGRSPSQIEVTENAIDPEFRDTVAASEVQGVLKKFDLKEGQFFFCLSNSKSHKNLSLLAAAYENAKKKSAKIYPLILSENVGTVTEDEARVLLATSAASFFPSLYEGFGLPPVEAAALGGAIVVSRIPPHQEVLSDLKPDEALWLDPKNSSEWTDAFLRAYEKPLKRVESSSREKILSRFSLDSLGQKMDRIYRRVLKNEL